MEDSAEEAVQKEKKVEEAEGDEQEGDERGRPSTPKWWRPPVPPETYKWEEVRRQRQKGGYPWTHLDKDEEIDADDYLDDNLYEPVNPPPLYGNDGYLSKELQQVPQSENRMIEIPPEIEILTSEGLDGLDKPDPIDKGFDGDREWQNTSEDEGGRQSRSSFKAGIRAPGESRSTTPKSVGFSPETITHETPADDDMEDQEVPGDGEPEPSSSHGSRGRRSRSNSPGRKQTAFDILKSKAADAADHVRQRIRSAIPVRPKLTKSRKRRKLKHEQGDGGEQEVPGDAEIKEGEEGGEEQQEEKANTAAEEAGEEKEEPGDTTEAAGEDAGEDEEGKPAKQLEKEERERKKAEAKQAKLEEKLAKAREAEEKRQAKAEEEKRKQQEKEEAAKKAAEEKKAEEERKAAEKAAKEEAARIAAEAKKAEEEAKKAAEKARKEEEARKKAEAKKAEEERKAAEKAKKEEEARKAAEAKKAEEERKAAEKAAKEEEARKAAEVKKAAEEEARKEAEAKRAAEEAAKQAAQAETDEERGVETVEETQPMDTTEGEPETEAGEAQGEEGNEEGMEVAQPQTPSGTTKRKYIKHRRQPIALSQIPNPITTLRNQVEDFKNKLRRSRTPPRRPVQRKGRRSRSADASKSPPRDPDEVSQKTEEGEEQEAAKPEDETAGQEQSKSGEKESEPCVKSEAKTSESVEKSDEAVQQSAGDEEVASKAPSEEPQPTASNTGTTGRRRKQHPAKEKLDKVGASIKGVGVKSLDIASEATKGVGNTLKAIGKLGAKVVGEVSKGIQESKVKPEPQEVEQEPTIEHENAPAEPPDLQPEAVPEVLPPKRTFRFKRRGESQEEEDEEHFYENAQEVNQENTLLGSGARDWESPQDRAHSRGDSEERFSGKISSRDSPPGSSLASSTIAQVRRTGVLEEIDSDEFFLRERGISEGEDEEEVNRFLVEELRQAFRPSLSNALSGFDMEPPLVPPSRPERAPRKPPRKDKESANPPTYQTFPPERPKRGKGPQGYVSKFMEDQDEEDGEYLGSNEEVRGSTGDMEEELEGSDVIQAVKDKLSELDRELEDTESAVEAPEASRTVEQYEDDGRYEPINDGPTKPTRTKRKQPKRPPTPPSFYYNTIAANEWLRGLEDHPSGNEPAPPVRKRRGSGKSSSIAPSEEGNRDENIPAYSELNRSATVSVQESGNEDNADYVDEAGYAIVQKDRDLPKTIPRKKKKRTNLTGQTGAAQGDATFFSLPRGSPPTRPNRTYSTLRPRRPPRSKSGSRQNLSDEKSPVSARREGDEPRPSTAIGIMQGRPLPPPPRPQRSPAPPLNELDQSSIEMAVGLRHYANFEDIESRPLEETSPPRVIEVDMACQTDPVPEDEFIVGITEHTHLEDSGIVRTASLRLGAPPIQQAESHQGASSTATTTAGDVSSSSQTPPSQPPPPPQNTQTEDPSIPPNPSPTPFSFPTRLHLEQLEVDFLRVNDLCAQSIKVENLQASNIEVNSISASGPVCVSRIQTDSLNSDEVNCSRLTSETVDMPSIPPSSYFQFSRSGQVCQPGSEQELCLKAEEKEDKENESACPPELFDSVNNLLENVDSTNDLKSSHVAEKIVDKQLNLPDASLAEDNYSTIDRKDASVGTNIPSTAPPEPLNDLNQTSVPESLPPTESTQKPEPVREVPNERQVIQNADQFSHSSPVSQVESATAQVEDEEPEEENVVCGSFALPYSSPYPPISSQSPPPTPSSSNLSRTSSLKKSQRSSSESAPKTPPTPRRSDAHIAFGHTSVAQGEVLSVKLSIPVERGSIGQAQSSPAPELRSPPRSRGGSNPRQLPESTNTQADSSRRDAQKKMEAQRKPVSPTTPTAAPPPAVASAQVPVSPPPPPLAQATVQRDSDESEEGFLETSMRLGRAVLRFTMRALQAMADYIDTAASEDPSKAEQQRANMQVLLCLLLVLLVGLILATTRSGPYSSPRWEFLMPPPDL